MAPMITLDNSGTKYKGSYYIVKLVKPIFYLQTKTYR